MGLYNVGGSTQAIIKASDWTSLTYTSTVAIAEAAPADATAVKAVIENRGSVDVYFGFGADAPASTALMLRLPPGYGWLEDGVSVAHLKIWVGGGIANVFIARWNS